MLLEGVSARKIKSGIKPGVEKNIISIIVSKEIKFQKCEEQYKANKE